jgi:trans-aconitate 2-methyltransferase
MIPLSLPQQTWNAQEYHLNSTVQKHAALNLLNHLTLSGNEIILDVGCGDGKLSASLSRRVPKGSVLGIDISPSMIAFAKQTFPSESFVNLHFEIQDAQSIDFNEEFDLIFSSFALHWVLKQDSFLKSAYKSLKPMGYLALTIPLDISKALDISVQSIMALPEWSEYFIDFIPNWMLTPPGDFYQMLKMNNFIPAMHEIVMETVTFSSRENFENYVYQWFPYFHSLPINLRKFFFQQVIDKYLELQPIENGQVKFIFSRMDIIAGKITL